MMLDLQTVCCLCGDIGFPDKLFRCNKCRHRFQHSYCSNYYGEIPEIELCDWCQSEEKDGSHIGSYYPRRSSARNDVGSSTSRSEYSTEKVKQHHDREDHSDGGCDKGQPAGAGAPSPRPGTRRYKLLKDVMC
ncbi:uncharacterized protein LOC129291091 [Prosopis cineraria]|uniref:uncharacterized protein LOC129291091 n=1 Tax=Prosopis cineraria TaxID=364024 RepID=UPI0024109FC0|nr:uncharacterized protein LOC129291091 [Prosopis cineraria]